MAASCSVPAVASAALSPPATALDLNAASSCTCEKRYTRFRQRIRIRTGGVVRLRWGRFGLIKQPRNASSSRAVGVAKEGRCGVPDPHSHSCWACDAFETPADILVWTRACKMLLCDCACRTCFECGHLRNAAASMAHAQRASMARVLCRRPCGRLAVELSEWRWSGVCMAVYQEHFHPVPRSTAAEPSDAPSSSVPRTSGAAALGIPVTKASNSRQLLPRTRFGRSRNV